MCHDPSTGDWHKYDDGNIKPISVDNMQIAMPSVSASSALEAVTSEI